MRNEAAELKSAPLDQLGHGAFFFRFIMMLKSIFFGIRVRGG